MTKLLMALVMFALTAYCGGIACDGYRNRSMPLFFGHRFTLVFDWTSNPTYFWAATIFNAAIVLVLALGGVILLIGAATSV